MTATVVPVLVVVGITEIEGGFPHSEIRGSKVVRTSPRLIAAYHVLHRLSAPRHPPDTLKTLDRSHYRCPPLGKERGTVKKDQFASNAPESVAVKQTLTSWSARHPPCGVRRSDTFSLYDGSKTRAAPNTVQRETKWTSAEGARDGDRCRKWRRHEVWWSQTGSNRRPHACKARALPTELWPRANSSIKAHAIGGPGKTRTSDLTLIKRAL